LLASVSCPWGTTLIVAALFDNGNVIELFLRSYVRTILSLQLMNGKDEINQFWESIEAACYLVEAMLFVSVIVGATDGHVGRHT
jgi:hypothetical protein